MPPKIKLRSVDIRGQNEEQKTDLFVAVTCRREDVRALGWERVWPLASLYVASLAEARWTRGNCGATLPAGKGIFFT